MQIEQDLLAHNRRRLRLVVRTASIPFASNTLRVTEPSSFRKASWSRACLNSQPRSHTSSSSIFRVMPFWINGLIQDTVIYCSGVRLSSGVLSWTVGALYTGLISSLGRPGSLRGILRITTIPTNASTGPRARLRPPGSDRMIASCASTMAANSNSRESEAVFGRSNTMIATEIPYSKSAPCHVQATKLLTQASEGDRDCVAT